MVLFFPIVPEMSHFYWEVPGSGNMAEDGTYGAYPGKEWLQTDGKPEPVYKIRMASSSDLASIGSNLAGI